MLIVRYHFGAEKHHRGGLHNVKTKYHGDLGTRQPHFSIEPAFKRRRSHSVFGSRFGRTTYIRDNLDREEGYGTVS